MLKDTKKMENFIECFECNGNGYVDSTYPVCSKPASECCGGCYESVECEYCVGSGEIHPVDEEMNDDIMMVNSYSNMLKDLKALKKELNTISVTCSEDASSMMNLMLNPQYEEDLKGLFNQINRIENHQEMLINNIKEGIERYNGN